MSEEEKLPPSISEIPTLPPSPVQPLPLPPTVGEIKFTLHNDGTISILTRLDDAEKSKNMGRLLYMINTGSLGAEIVYSLLSVPSANISTVQTVIEEWQHCKKQYKPNKLVVKPSEVLNRAVK